MAKTGITVGPLCAILKPLVKSMEVFGLFEATKASLVAPSENAERLDERTAKRYTRLALCSRIYSLLLLVVSWADLFRYSLSFWLGTWATKNYFLVRRTAWLLWLLQSCLNRSILVLSSERLGHIQRFHKLWSEFSSKESGGLPGLATTSDCHRWRSTAFVACVMAWVFTTVSQTYVVVTVLSHINSTVEFGVLFTNPFDPSLACELLFFFVNLLPSASAFFPIWYMFCHASILTDQFRRITSQLRESLELAGDAFPSNLEAIRQSHMYLCRLLSTLDKDFRLLVMSYYVTTFPLACVDVYSLVYGKADLFSASWTVLWNLIYVSNLTVITLGFARVNTAAHAPLELLHEVRVENATKTQLAQLNLFISRMSSTSIGFTALGLITITKEVLLTIGGLYLTYVFLVLQFKVD